MIRHAVYFWLKNSASTGDRDRLAAGLSALAEIDVVRGLQIGVPAATGVRAVVDNSFSVSALVLFDNEADEAVYQDHPLHQKFIAECGGLWAKVVIYDSKDFG